MHIQADRALIPAHSPAVRHLTITITAPGRQAPAAERSPASVALVLDRSGSMDGRKIVMARTAVAHAIQLLNERDHLAVVVYDDEVETVLASAPASNEVKTKARARLEQVEARGATNLSGGWFAGAGAVGAVADRLSRVLLLTDGLANRGIVDPDALGTAAANFRREGIVTSTFGVGADFDEELLSRIATEGGGHFYFIESAAQIPDLLASELGETLETVARDVVLDLTSSTGVDALVLNGFPVNTSPGRVRIVLGDLVADQEVTLALAVSCAAHLTEATAFVDCRVTDRDGVLFSDPMRVEWRAAHPIEEARQPVNHAVLIRVAEVLAERARATALAANRRGEFQEARHVIRNMIQHLRGLAAGSPQIQAIVAQLEEDERAMAQPMEPLARKSRHFASHAVAYSREADGKARRRRVSS
jgi:Ca-activated chloride channel homolog